MDLIQEPEENYKLGWIRLFRSIRNHWIWKDEKKLKWWLDLLLEVNHCDMKVNIGNDIIECNRGQSVRSLKGWADRWDVSKDTARNFLKLLEKDKMISLESYSKTTRITICNYVVYQPDLHDEQTMSKRLPTQTMNERIKKGKKEINTIHDSYTFDDFWKQYGKSSDKAKCTDKFDKLPVEKKELIKKRLPLYLATIKDKKFQKNPLTYLNGECWDDFPDEEVLEPQTKISFVKSGNSIDLSFKPKR